VICFLGFARTSSLAVLVFPNTGTLIPWGGAKGDEDMGGYHLVWTRDLVNSASGLLAAGNTSTALRALIYLAVCQQ